MEYSIKGVFFHKNPEKYNILQQDAANGGSCAISEAGVRQQQNRAAAGRIPGKNPS